VDVDDAFAAGDADLRPGPHGMLKIADTGIGIDAATPHLRRATRARRQPIRIHASF